MSEPQKLECTCDKITKTKFPCKACEEELKEQAGKIIEELRKRHEINSLMIQEMLKSHDLVNGVSGALKLAQQTGKWKLVFDDINPFLSDYDIYLIHYWSECLYRFTSQLLDYKRGNLRLISRTYEAPTEEELKERERKIKKGEKSKNKEVEVISSLRLSKVERNIAKAIESGTESMLTMFGISQTQINEVKSKIAKGAK